MYKLKSGVYITASPKYVEVFENNYRTRPIATDSDR